GPGVPATVIVAVLAPIGGIAVLAHALAAALPGGFRPVLLVPAAAMAAFSMSFVRVMGLNNRRSWLGLGGMLALIVVSVVAAYYPEQLVPLIHHNVSVATFYEVVKFTVVWLPVFCTYFYMLFRGKIYYLLHILVTATITILFAIICSIITTMIN